MLTRFVFAIVLVVGVCSSVYSETFLATITQVEGNKVIYKKATYHRDQAKYSHAEPVTAELSKDVTITKGHFLPSDGPTTTEGRMTAKPVPLKDGLEHNLFKKINDGKMLRPCLVTIADQGDDKGKITAINLWTSAFPK